MGHFNQSPLLNFWSFSCHHIALVNSDLPPTSAYQRQYCLLHYLSQDEPETEEHYPEAPSLFAFNLLQPVSKSLDHEKK